jgi:PAS domain S-box-containing protein
METQRLRRAMRDLVALSTLPAIWAGADTRRIPASLADVLHATLDLEIAYVRIDEPQPQPALEALRTPAAARASPEDFLARMREHLAGEPPPAFVEPGTGRQLRCAVTRFGMGDVTGVVVAASERADFPAEEDRVLLGVAANHACAELHRRNTERRLQTKTDSLQTLAREQERLLRQVQAERWRLEDVFEHSQSFMAVLTGPHHVFERANGKYMELVNGRDVIGKPLAEALPETVEQGFVQLVHDVFTSGRTYTGSDAAVLLQRADGSARTAYVDFVFQAMRGAEGEITGVFVQGIDLTERKRSEVSLARVTSESDRRRRLYETILSSTPDLVYVFDLEHRFTYANDILLKMWGCSWEEAIGRTCWQLGYEPWHAEMHDREIEQVKATRKPIRGEVPFEGTSGRRIYDYIFVPVIGPTGEVEAIAGTTRDVTERKLAQQELEALLQRETRRANLLGRVAQAGCKLNSVLDTEAVAAILTQEAREIIGSHQAVTSLTISDDWAQAVNAVSLSEKYAKYRDYSAKPDGSGIYSNVCRTNRPIG